MRIPIKNYLERAKRMGANPNFYLSEAYLELSGATGYHAFDLMWIQDNHISLFPIILKNNKLNSGIDNGFDFIWTDLGMIVGKGVQRTFLDFEYIFNPRDFDDLSGGAWSVFRKNVKKWPRANPRWRYIDHDELDAEFSDFYIRELLIEWLDVRKEDCQDAELLANFAYFSDHPGISRKYLVNELDRVVGINVWDENYQYINYRLCMVDKKQPHLDEFMRYLFYMDPDIRKKEKWVNDGGVLDNPNLEKFKDKMNPIMKRKIYSLRKK